MRLVALATLLAAIAATASADGISSPTTQFVGNMGEGASNPTGGGTPVIPCAQTGLVFTDACNAILYVVLF